MPLVVCPDPLGPPSLLLGVHSQASVHTVLMSYSRLPPALFIRLPLGYQTHLLAGTESQRQWDAPLTLPLFAKLAG